MKKEVKKLCISAFIIIVSLFVVDIISGFIGNKLMQKYLIMVLISQKKNMFCVQ